MYTTCNSSGSHRGTICVLSGFHSINSKDKSKVICARHMLRDLMDLCTHNLQATNMKEKLINCILFLQNYRQFRITRWMITSSQWTKRWVSSCNSTISNTSLLCSNICKSNIDNSHHRNWRWMKHFHKSCTKYDCCKRTCCS